MQPPCFHMQHKLMSDHSPLQFPDKIANNSVFGLSSCVFSRDQKRAFKVAAAMEAGGAVINGASFFRSFEMPFGGWKHSGIGTEGVLSTFNEMTRVKTIVLKNVL